MNKMQRRWAEWFVLQALQAVARSRSEYERRTAELYDLARRHTLRKTWGYQQRIRHNAPVALLMRAYGHSSEAQTLEYLCIQPDEIRNLYLNQEL